MGWRRLAFVAACASQSILDMGIFSFYMCLEEKA
jgi:hypothetical protein